MSEKRNFNEIFYKKLNLNHKNKLDYYFSYITSLNYINKIKLSSIIGGHIGCINTVLFNYDGSLIITGSDDMTIQLYNIYTKNLILKINTLHRGNIFDAKEIPNSNCNQFISCAGD